MSSSALYGVLDKQFNNSSTSFFTTGTALSTGAKRVKMDYNQQTYDGDLILRTKAVQNIESGKRVIVAVMDDAQTYVILGELI